jgi:adenine-specific DNA-methyltransferase
MIKKIMPNPFAEYFKSEMMRYFKTIAEFRKFVVGILKMDSAMVNRWFEGDSIISKERYLFIKDYLNNEYLRKEYEDLRKEYEDLRRPFNNQFRLTDVIDAKLKSSFHPTTKDGAVIEKLILTTTKENDLIFSPFLGSGTDRIAAYNTKRNIISCELDKNYFDQAEHHYQEHIKQGSLF